MKRILVLLLLVFVSLVGHSQAVRGQDSPTPLKKVLVVYEKRFYWRSNEDIAKAVDLLLHHFTVETKVIHSTDYWRGLAAYYDAVVYLPMEVKARPPHPLMQDLAQGTTPTLWIGGDLPSFLKANPQNGLEVVGESAEFTEILYKNQVLQDIRPISTTLMKIDPSRTEILAWQRKGTQTYPLAFHRGNLWFIGRLDFHQANAALTAEILHAFLGQEHPSNHQAFVRIEDVHPLREPARLKAIADLLGAKKVPFLIALIPVYTDGQGKQVTMSERPEFLDALKYMVAQGGSVVLHGYTHQHGKEETGRGYEFWDEKNNLPVAGDNTAYTKDRFEAGLLQCLKNGIVPLAFEPPHYGMSEEGYQYLRSTGTTLIAGIQTSDKGFSTTSFPVAIGANSYLGQVLPENLSYINSGLPDPVAPLLNRAREISLVRDGLAGAYFHPYLDRAYLERLTNGLLDQGYTFIDLKETSQLIQTDVCTIRAEEGKISYRIQQAKRSKVSSWANLYTGLLRFPYHLLQLGLLFMIILLCRLIKAKYNN